MAVRTLVNIKLMRRLWPKSEPKDPASHQPPATPRHLGPGSALEAPPPPPHATLGRISSGAVRRCSLPGPHPPATLERFWSPASRPARDELLPQQRVALGRRGSLGPTRCAAGEEGMGSGLPNRQLFL